MGRSRIILRAAAIATAGFLFSLPLFLALAWFSELVDYQPSHSGSAGRGTGGQLILLSLPSLLILWYLKKKSKYSKFLTASAEEIRPILFTGFSIAGLAFFAFLMNLHWFDVHNTARVLLGVFIMWLLIFSTTVGFFEAPKRK